MRRMLPVWLAAACVAAATAPLCAQTEAEEPPPRILTVEERDQDGGVDTTTALSAIVDINSKLRIYVDRVALRNGATAALGETPGLADLSERAMRLQAIADSGIEALPRLQQALSDWAASARHDTRDLQTALERVAPSALAIIEIAEGDPILRGRLNAALATSLDRSIVVQYRAVFEAALEEARLLGVRLDSVLTAGGVYIQMGGWVVGDGGQRPLHIPKFDRYPEGERFEVQRFNLKLLLSGDLRSRFEQAEQTAASINERGVGGALGLQRASPEAILPLLEPLDSCATVLEGGVQSLTATAEAGIEALQARLEATLSALRGYRAFLAGLQERYAGEGETAVMGPGTFLQSTASDLLELLERTERLTRTISDYSEMLAVAARTGEAFGDARSAAAGCQDQLVRYASAIESLQGVFGGSAAAQSINSEALEFGDEVLKLDLQDVPSETEVSLITAGARQSGDVLVLKIAAGNAEQGRNDLEVAELTMVRVLPHLELAVGLNFADPLDSTGVTNRFQAAPAYSVLYTWGSRGSMVYNRLLRVGFGVNVAALDFDKDDTPELGVGFVISTFRNFLQAGIGYNIPDDSGYWFFGLKLPTASFTLPGVQNEGA